MPETTKLIDEMAEDIFALFRVIASARSRGQTGSSDLSESEFVTLDILSKEGPITIGAVQKRVGVAPAQMSRVVRALEVEGGRGFVECKINPDDRRCVNLSLTDAGRKAFVAFRHSRLSSFRTILEALEPADRGEFMRMLKCIGDAFTP